MEDPFKSGDISFFKSLMRKAGALAAKYQHGALEVKRKSDRSIVTQADQAVQDFIISRISGRYRNLNYIYEENFSSVMQELDDSMTTVIIDPIDGTAVYSMYLPLWCVSIGIFQGYNPLYGFVYSPGANMLFHNDGRYAYLNDEIRQVDKDMPVDSESNILQASEVRNKYIVDFQGKVRNFGSTALQACLTIDNARNRTIAFIGKSNLWDWAGAVPIILRAGGALKYINGEEIDYKAIIKNKCKLTEYLVAYNSRNFSDIRKLFKRR